MVHSLCFSCKIEYMFKSRVDAGQQLTQKILDEIGVLSRENAVVLSIPRGGVVIGNEVATKLSLPHDVIVTKKIPSSGEKELAIGAVGETKGSVYLNNRLVTSLKISQNYVRDTIEKLQQEIAERENMYRKKMPEIRLTDKRVLIIDDGAATGSTMVAAVREIWNRKPKQVIVALPVCPVETLKLLEKEADVVLVVEVPPMFYAISQYYEAFPQITDEEVVNIIGSKQG